MTTKLVLPRYTIGSVTGWKISAASMQTDRRRPTGTPPTLWYVQDRLNCHRVVAEFIQGGYLPKARVSIRCDELNREYEQWLRDQDLMW